MPARFEFHITTADPQTAARTGIFETPHGRLLTPVFAPVGTQATVKTLTPRDLAEIGATLILANIYHLYLHPCTKLGNSITCTDPDALAGAGSYFYLVQAHGAAGATIVSNQTGVFSFAMQPGE